MEDLKSELKSSLEKYDNRIEGMKNTITEDIKQFRQELNQLREGIYPTKKEVTSSILNFVLPIIVGIIGYVLGEFF